MDRDQLIRTIVLHYAYTSDIFEVAPLADAILAAQGQSVRLEVVEAHSDFYDQAVTDLTAERDVAQTRVQRLTEALRRAAMGYHAMLENPAKKTWDTCTHLTCVEARAALEPLTADGPQ